MASNVVFQFLDSRGRAKTRTLVNVSDVIATVLADVAVLGPLWDVLTDLQLVGVTISVKSTATAFAGAAISNVDENVSAQVLQGNGFKADFNLPDMPDSFTPAGVIDPVDISIAAFFAEFLIGATWRINTQNPQDITTVISGVLDK